MPSLVSLAEALLVQARKVDETLIQNGIPATSFDEDTLDLLPEEMQGLRSNLLDTTHELRQLVRGARWSGYDIAFSWTHQLVLRIIWRYKLALTIPRDGSASYAEISAASGLSTSLVVRTIRAAMTLNIFDEAEPGRVRHTAISKLLADDEGYSDVIGLQVEDIGPAGLGLIEAWDMFGNDVEDPDKCAFSLYNSGRSLFQVLAEEPVRAGRFNSAMKAIVEATDFSFNDIVTAFDWSSLDRPGSRLIDLGGGYGQVSQVLAKCTQNLMFTIQDLPHAVEKGRADLPVELKNRIDFQAQSFLEPQSATQDSPDAFLISRCLHNWSDYHSARILRGLVPALTKGSKVLIWDTVLSDGPVTQFSERFELQQDFIMATISNGKDRSLEEFRQILELSDERFAIESVSRPAGCKLSLIEVSWKG